MATDQTNQVKKIFDCPLVSSTTSGDQMLLLQGGGVKRLNMSNLVAPKATSAEVLSATPYSFTGSTIAELKQSLLERINAISYTCVPMFRMSIDYDSFKHFNDDDWVMPSDTRYNVNWFVIAHNSGPNFDYVQLIAGPTSSSNLYTIFINRTGNNNAIWYCRKIATTEP